MTMITERSRGLILSDVPLNDLGIKVERIKDLKDLIKYMRHQTFGDEPTIVAYRGVWGDLDRIFDEANANGVNLYNLDFIDTYLEKHFAKNLVNIERIIYARFIRLFYSETIKTPVRISGSKSITRRDLLRSHIRTILQFINKPVVNDRMCLMLPHCNICVDTCPKKAISGKPPSIQYNLCDLCGLCISVCPVEAIYTPQTTPRSIEEYLSIIRKFSGEPMKIVVIQYHLLKDLMNIRLEDIKYPFIVLPVWSLKEISPLMILRMIYLGFTPVLYGEETINHLIDLFRLGVIKLVNNINELITLLSEDTLYKSRGEEIPGLRIYVVETLSLFTNETSLNFPGASYIEIDKDRCTLCGACVRICPTKALRILDVGNERRLVFEPLQCLSCKECENICPEKALRVRWLFKRDYYQEEKILTSSPIVHCSICGAPIETEIFISRVEERLRKAGAHEALKYTRICEKCKTKLILQPMIK
ncbi:MAG: ATP-binding protein [Sulfolobales archaeon]